MRGRLAFALTACGSFHSTTRADSPAELTRPSFAELANLRVTLVSRRPQRLADPVQVLFGVQLGGGTDINQAIAYCAQRIERPQQTHLVLVSDLCEGGNGEELLARAAALVRQGVNLIVLLALSDEGRPAYDARMAEAFAALGAPVFACTPDQFPDRMATALRREDVLAWAADRDIKAIRAC